MKYIDLHVHSTVSDGTLTPTQLVEEAKRANLSAFALTDHDTTAGVSEALEAAKGSNIEVVPGAEISAGYKEKDIHILGLYLDHKNDQLNNCLAQALEERDNRNIQMANNLNKAGLDIDIDRLKAANPPGTVLTRAHFGRFLLEHKQVKSINEAFERYLGTDCPCYVPREYISPEDTISLIKQAGGVPILAHPLIYKLPENELDQLIKRLKNAGLEGIEVFYSANTGFDEGIVRRYANRYDLVMSGGSDFHGVNKPSIQLGTGRGNLCIPYSVLENIRALR